MAGCEVVGRRLVDQLAGARNGRQSASIQSIIGSEALWRGDLPRARTALMIARDLFDRLAKLSGYSLFLCTKSGRPLLTGVPVPPAELQERLPEEFDAPPGIEGGYVKAGFNF